VNHDGFSGFSLNELASQTAQDAATGTQTTSACAAGTVANSHVMTMGVKAANIRRAHPAIV
jgi:hypothetical protein